MKPGTHCKSGLAAAVSALAILAAFAALFMGCAFGGNASDHAAPMQILHAPRLGLVMSGSATISWDTSQPVAGRVEWGTSPAYDRVLPEARPATHHHVTLAGLSPGTTYHFRIVADRAGVGDCTLTTAPPPGVDFSFASLADNRGTSIPADLVALPRAFLDIMARIRDKAPSFVLHGGDLFYGSPVLAEQARMYEVFKSATDAVAARIPFLVSPGNHEMDLVTGQFDSLVLFGSQFGQPAILPGYEGTIYSWDWGNSHFASVDSCHYDPARPSNGMYY